ncbi:adenosine deaminase/editase [Chytriomyces sp. MP71]|nr:adenosine deaminase/editase [Chytriomyces sp. MP71]
MSEVANLVASTALAALSRLRHKEGANRWTVGAAVVQLRDGRDAEAVAIGTGVKCLSMSQAREGAGAVVADVHAEVLCRRAFIRYLMSEMHLSLKAQKSIFSFSKDTKDQFPLALNASFTFHFYISQSPCGDASTECLDSSQSEEERFTNESKRRKYLDGTAQPSNSIPDASTPTVPHEFAAAQRRGEVLRGRLDFTKHGILRTKPGRIDAEMSLSMSCSDKICKWLVLGASGALLGHFIRPIFFEGIVVGDWFDEVALRRALIIRSHGILDLPAEYSNRPTPFLAQANLPFSYSKLHLESISDTKLLPSDVGVAWTKGLDPKDALQVLNNCGRKQGSAKRKGMWMSSARSGVCNEMVRDSFLRLVSEAQGRRDDCTAEGRNKLEGFVHGCQGQEADEGSPCPQTLRNVDVDNLSYGKLKRLNSEYYKAREAFLNHEPFRGWVLKANLSSK